MDEHELDERLWAVAERFFPREGGIARSGGQARPFDIECPVLHESKAEFEAELSEVQALKNACETLIKFLQNLAGKKGDEPQLRAKNIEAALDAEARKGLTHAPFDGVYSVLRALASRQGQTVMTIVAVMDLESAIDKRLQDLEAQRGEYWSLPHRAPNHFARIIALRFAKAIAFKTGKRPTIGVSREGSHPSTDFGRALEEVFELLSIKADFRRAGEWAVKQIEDGDLGPSLPITNLYAEVINGLSNDGENRPLKGIAAAMARYSSTAK